VLVLAGGKAGRFQGLHTVWLDKALALFEGKPLLVWVVENVVGEVDEVVVCVNSEERKAWYLEVLEKYHLGVRIVVDEKVEVEGGPNVAILSGLKAVQTDFCMTIPCDMPFVKPEVVNYLFNLSETEGFEVVVPMWPNGILETLLMVLERSRAVEMVQTLCQFKRSRPCDIPRATSKTMLASPLKTIKTLDPDFKSFININTQEDLKKLQTRNIQGLVQQNIVFNREGLLVSDLQLMRDAVKMLQKDNFRKAQEKFDFCKRHFEDEDNFFWTALASEGKGEALLKQAQLPLSELRLQKENMLQTVFSLSYECKEALSNAVDNYHNEARLYKKNHCTRLLERAIADKQNTLSLKSSIQHFLTNN